MKINLKTKSRWKRAIEDATEPVKIKDIDVPKFNIMYSLRCKDPDGITQSLITSYLKCRREFLFKLNRWTNAKKAKSYAFGSIAHETLDKVYTYYMEHKKLPGLTLIKEWVNTYDKGRPNWLPLSKAEEIERYKGVCYVLITEYIRYYRDDFKPGRLLGAEDLFDNRWHNYRLRGKKDLRFLIAQKIWIMETKTSSRIEEETLMDRLSFDFQNLFYVHNEEVSEKRNVEGVLYNILRNPGLKVGGLSLLQYCNKVRKDIRKRPGHYFKRYEIPYTPADKSEFKKELVVILSEIHQFLMDGKIRAYKNPRSCVGKFPCSFLKACSTGLMMGYKQNEKLFKELEVM